VLKDIDGSLRTLEVLSFEGRNVVAHLSEFVLKLSVLVMETIVFINLSGELLLKFKSDGSFFGEISDDGLLL
jgi:hypothetical protein